MVNFYAGWAGMFAGCVAGVVMGLFFHQKDWLGGYGSFSRRMLRLGHISFFGIGLINIFYALSLKAFSFTPDKSVSILFLIAAVAMPAVCYISAYKKMFRHLFFIPALSLTSGVGIFLLRILFP